MKCRMHKTSKYNSKAKKKTKKTQQNNVSGFFTNSIKLSQINKFQNLSLKVILIWLTVNKVFKNKNTVIFFKKNLKWG